MIKIFAADLKALREEKNISLKDISHYTKINVTILENLESGDFTFQPQAYIRAFLKQYISQLGLDVEETLFDYDLARSGKYKTRRPNVVVAEEEVSEQETPDSRGSKLRITEKLKEMVETPKKIIEEKNNIRDPKTGSEEKIISEHSLKNRPNELKGESKSSLKKDAANNEDQNKNPAKSFFGISLLNLPIVKNLSLIIFILLILIGIYSLINILFIEGSKDNPEIIRQNFDDVVSEQERKILGTKTPEEIQDSIGRAEEDALAAKDSVVLRLSSTSPITVFLITDSLNYNNPAKIVLREDASIFRARKFFYISTDNTESIKATVNNKPIKFENKSINKVKLAKGGIAK